jgi:hypothetical protein
MATQPVQASAIWPDSMSQWLRSQAGQSVTAIDPEVDTRPDPDDPERIILRPVWPRVFPPL